MKQRFEGLIALICTLTVASACDIDIEGPDDDGRGSSDTDDAGDGSGGKSIITGGGSDGDDSGSDDSDGTDDDSNGTGLDPQDPGDGGTGGEDPEPGTTGSDAVGACDLYCDNELGCDDFYQTAEDCMAACEDMRQDAGSCADQLDGLNACVGSLSCSEFFAYWSALEHLSDGGEVTVDVPCFAELASFVECTDPGDTPPGGPAPAGP